MSNLIRWEPAREMMTLREAMDHLFDDAFTRPLRLGDGHWSMPAVDMYQTDNEIVVKAAIPGVKTDEVQINVTGEVLTIKGEVKEKEEVKEKAYHLREQRWGIVRTLDCPAHRCHRRQGQGRVREWYPHHHPSQSRRSPPQDH